MRVFLLGKRLQLGRQHIAVVGLGDGIDCGHFEIGRAVVAPKGLKYLSACVQLPDHLHEGVLWFEDRILLLHLSVLLVLYLGPVFL